MYNFKSRFVKVIIVYNIGVIKYLVFKYFLDSDLFSVNCIIFFELEYGFLWGMELCIR